MVYSHNQQPTPLGTRLPAMLLARIYHLAITYPRAIPLDSTNRQQLCPPLLKTSAYIRSHFLPAFLETNTFTLRRASLCRRAENNTNPALTIPMHHRVHIRRLLILIYTGARECVKLELRHPHRNASQARRIPWWEQDRRRPKQQQQQQICPFCDPATFPPLLAVFPRLRGVTVDVAANRESGLVWRAFCKAAVQKNRSVWVACTGIGEGVLQNEAMSFGMKIRIEDGKLKSEAAHLYCWLNVCLTENGSPVDDMYGRQSWCKRMLTLTEDNIKPKQPLALRWDTCHWYETERCNPRQCLRHNADLSPSPCWPWDFVTPWNWALRV
jgi:hypothetical protein